MMFSELVAERLNLVNGSLVSISRGSMHHHLRFEMTSCGCPVGVHVRFDLTAFVCGRFGQENGKSEEKKSSDASNLPNLPTITR